MSKVNNVSFDRERYTQLRRSYDQAVAEGKEQFYFDGLTFVTAYAKYVLEYLGTKFDQEVQHGK